MDESPHAVLDANLIVRGLLTPYGGSGRVLRALAEGLFVFVTPESILYEVATTLSEPRVQRYGSFQPTKSGSVWICFAASASSSPAAST